ncbi:MAG: hypothetical protein AMXMBFR4_12990 [Candidatus Hydrogenedentota bacterium]
MNTSHENNAPKTLAMSRKLTAIVAIVMCAALVGGGLMAPAALAADEKGLAQLKVKKPNGGEIWVRGQEEKIRWRSKSGGFTGFAVRIELLKNGAFYRTITSSTPNDGRFKWVVPNDVELDDDYKVRIVSLDYPAIRDRSNAPFTIVPFI